jgi:hypothetical protein
MQRLFFFVGLNGRFVNQPTSSRKGVPFVRRRLMLIIQQIGAISGAAVFVFVVRIKYAPNDDVSGILALLTALRRFRLAARGFLVCWTQRARMMQANEKPARGVLLIFA